MIQTMLCKDYYMANAMKKGYDVFKEIGVSMNAIFQCYGGFKYYQFLYDGSL